MTDSSIYGRLTDIAENLRQEWPDTASTIDSIANDILELAGNMRGRSEASMEDTGVEAKGFLAEAMDQYADKLDTSGTVTPPAAGTSAYEMLALAEQRNVEVTEALIHMVAATVLSKLIDDEGGGRSNIAFSPLDMDAMSQRYDMTATRDGMLTVISIKAKEGAFKDAIAEMKAAPTSLYLEDGIDSGEPAEPQALAHEHDRPLWAARIDGELRPTSDREGAERKVKYAARADRVGQVENRFCYHNDCPAERCNHVPKSDDTPTGDAEVTSDD